MNAPAIPPQSPTRALRQLPPGAWRLHRLGALLAPALLLAACSSSPLPPWPGGQPRVPVVVVPPVPAQAPAPAPIETVPGAVVTPIAPRDEAVVPTTVAPPFSEAVAARFPEPSVVYDTPGLRADRTGYTTNAELRAALDDLARGAAGATRATVLDAGLSQQGQPLAALVLTRSASTDPAAVLADGRPTVLLVGQQHGNEPAPAEALLVVARELARGSLQFLLDRINVVVMPRANPDGAAADTRVTAGRIDMNRDHLLLRTPEARAIAKLARDYQPMVVVDAHEFTAGGRFQEKFGLVQRYDALLQYATTPNVPEFVTKAAEEWFRQPMVAALNRQSLSNEWYFTTSDRMDDRSVSMGGARPDTSRNVYGLRNAVSLLVETRGVGVGRSHIQRRVHSHVVAATAALQSTANRAEQLKQLRSFVNRDVSALACRQENAVIDAQQMPGERTLVGIDPQSGLDRELPVRWNSSLQLKPVKTRHRPCGYWLDGANAPAVERLQALGVQVMRVTEPASLLMETYVETSRTRAARADVRGTIDDAAAPDGGAVQVAVNLSRTLVDAPQGSYYVPLGQPLGSLAMAALEPDTQNSYVANRLIDTVDGVARVLVPPTFQVEELPRP
ncbi:MAG: M14 family metallocarboxypeptidase [Xylophilus ampelinus]